MSATVEALCQRRGIGLKFHACGARGRELCGPCPVCGGTDRFTVFPDQNDGAGSFWCRGCGIAGDVIDFLRKVEGMSFAEASREAGRECQPPVRRMLPSAGKPAPAEKKGLRPARTAAVSGDRTEVTDAAAWSAQAKHFVQTRHAALLGNAEALSWLAARGLDGPAVQRFRLGWQEGERGRGGIMRFRTAWGLADGAPRKAGDPPRKGLWIPRGWVIPMLDAGGKALRIRIRRTEEDRRSSMEKLKYYVLPGSGMQPLFLLPEGGVFARPMFFVVVESELDAMLVWRAAGDFAGAVGAGTAKIRSLPPASLAALEKAALILVATDSDEAGDAGFEAWKATFEQAVRLRCLAKDPGEMFPSAGWQGIRRWILDALPPLYAQRVPPAVRTPGKEEESARADQDAAPDPAPADRTEEQPPVAAEVPAAPAPAFSWPLDGEYVGEQLVLDVLASHGLGVRPHRGDIVITGREKLCRRDDRLLFGFVTRHRVELDGIARRLNSK